MHDTSPLEKPESAEEAADRGYDATMLLTEKISTARLR